VKKTRAGFKTFPKCSWAGNPFFLLMLGAMSGGGCYA